MPGRIDTLLLIRQNHQRIIAADFRCLWKATVRGWRLMAAGCHLSLVRWTLESLVPMGSTPSTSSSIRGVSSPVSSSASSRANRACTSRYSVVLWCLAHYDTVQSMPVSLRDHSMHKVCCVSTQASKPLRLLGFALHDASAMFWWLRVLSEATNLLSSQQSVCCDVCCHKKDCSA